MCIRDRGDPELNYASAAHLAYCRRAAEAVPLLKLSIAAKHCSHPALERDPMMANLRKLPEHAEIRESAIACEEDFLRQKQRFDRTMR